LTNVPGVESQSCGLPPSAPAANALRSMDHTPEQSLTGGALPADDSTGVRRVGSPTQWTPPWNGTARRPLEP
jgi:hypothetical protein